MSKKEYTPIEVAKSVLKKTEEMLKSHSFMSKAAKDYPKGLAAENIKEHMKHKEEHPGGAKQAIAIGIEQARRGEKEAKKSELEKSGLSAEEAAKQIKGPAKVNEVMPKVKPEERKEVFKELKEMDKSAQVNKSPAQAGELKGVSVPKPPQMPKPQAMKSPRPLKQFMQKREGKKGGSK